MTSNFEVEKEYVRGEMQRRLECLLTLTRYSHLLSRNWPSKSALYLSSVQIWLGSMVPVGAEQYLQDVVYWISEGMVQEGGSKC